MTARYFAILTNQGAARLANAAALGTTLNITQMAVGDANGVLPTPDPAQTALINQKRIAALNMLSIDPNNSSQIIAEQVIPENEGGYWIREIGLYDDSGVLVAVANCPETYKPLLQEGSGRTQTIRMVLIVSSTAAVTLKIDPAVVLATRQYVDNKVIEVKAYADNLLSQHIAASNPHTQYAPIASPTFTGTPKAPTAAQTANDTQLATTAFVKAAIAALVASSPAALDTLSELAAALGNDPNFATTMTNALAGKQPLDAMLTALSNLNTANMQFPVFNGPKSIEIGALTNLSLLFLSKSTPAQMLDLLTAAPRVSPALTGQPTAPTAAAGTNTTQIATTEFVANFISTLKAAAFRDVGTGANQIPDMTSFTSGANWFRLPNGFIVQFFVAVMADTSAASKVVNFPFAFPNAAISVVATHNGPQPGAAGIFGINNLSKATFQSYTSVTPTGSIGAFIIAVGY